MSCAVLYSHHRTTDFYVHCLPKCCAGFSTTYLLSLNASGVSFLSRSADTRWVLASSLSYSMTPIPVGFWLFSLFYGRASIRIGSWLARLAYRGVTIGFGWHC